MPEAGERNGKDAAEWLYAAIAEEEDARVCTAISDEACREVPGNFFRHLVSITLTNIGDQLASAKTVVPWLLQFVGAPGWMTGFLVPIRESGSLLPQLLIAAAVRRTPVRKWFWVGGSVLQFASVAAMGIVAWNLRGWAAGMAVVLLLCLFSLARGFCSVASKDVLGKTIPKTRRGRLQGLISSVSGAVTLAAALGLALKDPEGSGRLWFGLLLAAGLLWLAGAAVYATIREFPGATEGGGNAMTHAVGKIALLREDAAFRRFVTVRALAMGSGLVAPFYVALAVGDLGRGTGLLGQLVAAQGLASLVSGFVWGRFADRSSRAVLSAASLLAAVLGLAALVWTFTAPSGPAAAWFWPVLFFLLGVAHSGVRLGRKTYLVDLAEGNRRTDYVAVSNTVIGALLLAFGAAGSAVAAVSLPAVVAVFAAISLAAAALCCTLPETSK